MPDTNLAELLSALRDARAYVRADLDHLLRSYCLLDKGGDPILETLDQDDCDGVIEANEMLERIDAAISRFTETS